jgi:hypothetical protein
MRTLARNQFDLEFSGAFGERCLEYGGILVVNESRRLLNAWSLMSDHVHEPVLDVWD